MKLRMLVVAAVGCLVIPVMSHAQATDTSAAHPTPPSDGTTCPWKCPTSKGAAGLTGVQFLALQQELRDRGCGNAHVTGWLDAPTRKAISTCAKRLSVENKAAAVLAAFNIGFAASELGTGTGMGGGGAMPAEGSKAEEAKESPKKERAEKRAASHKAPTKSMKMKTDTTMKKDSTTHS